MPAEPMFVWTVATYCDHVKRRKRRIVQKERARGWRTDEPCFDTEAKAYAYLVIRAEAAVNLARLELKRAEKRLAKCQQRRSLVAEAENAR